MKRIALALMLAIVLVSMTNGCGTKAVNLEVVAQSAGPIDPAQQVWFTFNRKVPDHKRSVDIEPPGLYQVTWSPDGKTATLVPAEQWHYGQRYEVLFGKELSVDFAIRPVPKVSVVVGGDVLLDRRPGENIARYGPEYVFAGVAPLLRTADIAFANLESPASRRGEPVQKNFRFRSTPEALDALIAAGIDIVSFANNHTHDYGLDGFLDTLTHLRERGIAHVGAGRNRSEALRPHIITVDGVRVAFIAFTQNSFLPKWSFSLWEATDDKPGVVFLEGEKGRQDVLSAVQAARSQADVVLVSLHWGYEGTLAPNAWQKELGRAIIDAGATAIIGHHPHLPFGVEVYRGKPIIYSLGNFLFHPFDPEARESFVARLDISLSGHVDVALYPILTDNGTVSLLKSSAADNIVKTIIERSQNLGTSLVREQDYILVHGER